MDLGTLDTVAASDDGIAMQIRHPVTSVPLWQDDACEVPVTITVAGMDSAIFRLAERVNRDRRLKGLRLRTPSAEELDAEAVELLAKCTLGWQGIILNDRPIEFTASNVRMLYKRLPWLREQVDNFMGDRANFLPNSPKG